MEIFKSAIKPNRLVKRIALTGTPRDVVLARNAGARFALAWAQIQRLAMYIAELIDERSVITMILLIKFPAPAQPALFSAIVNGEEADFEAALRSSVELEGTIRPVKNTMPT